MMPANVGWKGVILVARRVKFPHVDDYAASRKVVLYPAERVLKLFNQTKPLKEAARVSKTVREWFHEEALENGWGGTVFLPAVQTNHSGGCVLFRPSNPTTVNITATMVVLADSTDMDEG
jgi:hypothetical protein